MKRIALTLALSLFAAGAVAQHAHPGAPSLVAQAAAKDLADGEIRKIDKAAGKIMLRHGEIKSIGMAPMTMVFKGKDPALLEKVAVNDKVKFNVIQSGGDYVVTSIEKAK
jgi:Cu/Ag efflux protein CusF